MTSTHLLPSASHPDSAYLVAQSASPWKDGRRTASILVATDGTERSEGALRVAAARAHSTGALLEVMIVLEREPHLSSDDGYFGDSRILHRRTAQRRAVEEQLTRVLGPDHLHSISVFDGNPAFTISRVAIERHASLIVVGLGRHLIADRLFSNETALQLARIARVPVLAVPEDGRVSPRHAVVAVDFSDISLRAAQSAIETVSDEGHVDLVHVMPHVGEDAFTLEAEEPYQRWVEQQLADLAEHLVVPPGVTVSRVALRGQRSAEVLAYASRVGADLVVTGTHGLGFVARTIVGSVTAKLLRGATCAILAVPRDPLPALQTSARQAAGEAFESPLAWRQLLVEFSKRNAGRRTILEVDEVEIGAQAQEYNYPLLGVSYTARDGRLELMVGDRSAGGRHLSRSIGNIAAVEVLTDGEGNDVALRVQHGTSQTLLTFAQ